MKSVTRYLSGAALGLALVLAARPAAALDLNGYFNGKYIQGDHACLVSASITQSGARVFVYGGMDQTIDGVAYFSADLTLDGTHVSGSVDLQGAEGVLDTVSTTGKTNSKGTKVKLTLTRSTGEALKIKLNRYNGHH